MSANRIYTGDPRLIHVPRDELRKDFGYEMAEKLTKLMHQAALDAGTKTPVELTEQRLCPGCYMVIGLNMLVALAEANGQDRAEMARSMATAFTSLAESPDEIPEEIFTVLDPPDCNAGQLEPSAKNPDEGMNFINQPYDWALYGERP